VCCHVLFQWSKRWPRSSCAITLFVSALLREREPQT